MMMLKHIFAFLLLSRAIFAAGHNDWRVFTISGVGGGPVAIAECEFYDLAGNLLSTGGTASSSTTFPGHPAANAFDGNFTSYWESSNPASNDWLRYAFAAAADVGVVRIVGGRFPNSGSYDGTEPSPFRLQYSDDGGSTWIDATSNLTPPTWTGPSAPTAWVPVWSFTISTNPPLSGFYVNYRVRGQCTGGCGSYVGATEIGLKDVAGGANVTTATLEYGQFVTEFSGQPNYVFDGVNSTWNLINPGTGGGWFGYSFPMPHRIVEMDWTNLNTSSGVGWANSSPTSAILEGSNDAGMSWTTVLSCSYSSWSAQNQTKVCGITPDQRGNIAYNQIRATDRAGAGHQIQMSGGGASQANNPAVFDAGGNVVPIAGNYLTLVSTPASHSSFCLVGQFSVDGSGNWYWCYGISLWARIGPGGYSNSF